MQLQGKTVLLAGGTGLVGQKLISLLRKMDCSIVVLSRKQRISDEEVQYVVWNPSEKYISPACPKPHVIINLAGEGIADGMWTKKRKQALLDSRVQSAATLQSWLEKENITLELYIGASAVGYYGDRGEERLTEDSLPGKEFMSNICVQWEMAHKTVMPWVNRLVILRIGVVLSQDGGALPKTLMTKSLGILPVFGQGRQFYPWIHEEDLCRIIVASIMNTNYTGVINAVAPEEIRVKESMKEIQKTMGGIWWLTAIPTWLLRLGMGEMSRVILNSNRVSAEVLNSLGFEYNFGRFSEAVRNLVKGNP